MADEKMPFVAHLGELRNRLVVSLVSVLLGFVACFHFSEEIFRGLTIPMRSDIAFKAAYPFITLIARADASHDLVFLAPAEAFWVHLKIALIASIIICSPIIFWQIWKFISPGLLTKEKKYAIPFISVTSGLFIAGTVFCFLIVLPFAMGFLLTYKTESLVPMISVERYIDFCLKFILAFGVVFELPVVIVFLTRMGVVTPRTLAKNRKYAVLLAFVAAAILTPTPDAFNQTLMAGPIIVLFEGGLLAARIFERKKPPEGSERPVGTKQEDAGGPEKGEGE